MYEMSPGRWFSLVLTLFGLRAQAAHALCAEPLLDELLALGPGYSLTFWGAADATMSAAIVRRDHRRTYVDTHAPPSWKVTIGILLSRWLGVMKVSI